MALSERSINDKIEVVGEYKIVQVRRADIIEKDGKEVARSFHRHLLVPGSVDDSDNWTDTDISGEGADVQAICNAAWTTDIKNAYKAHLIATRPS